MSKRTYFRKIKGEEFSVNNTNYSENNSNINNNKKEIQKAVKNYIENPNSGNCVVEEINNIDSTPESENNNLTVNCEDDEHETINKYFDLETELAEWGIKHNATNDAMNALLKILRKYHPTLPKDCRTEKKLQKIELTPLDAGSYLYFGLRHKLQLLLQKYKNFNGDLIIDIGIDGLPLSKSSNSQLWHILGNVVGLEDVFLIRTYHGYTKPSCANTVARNYKLLKTQHDEKFEKLQKTCDTIVSNQRSIMRELILLRHKYSKETKNMENNETILNRPTKSTQELIDLEDKIRKDPHSENCLKITFDVNINDLTKYIRCNLKKVMLDEVAANFFWFGHQQNVSIKNYLIIKILKGSALQHFKNFNDEEVTQIIKRWFQLAIS